jgi:hypothetical protein
MVLQANCPNCSAPVAPRDTRCGYCHTALTPEPLGPEIRNAAILLIRSSNKELDSVTSPGLVAAVIVGTVAVPVLVYFLSRALGAPLAMRWILAMIAALTGFFVVGSILPGIEDRMFDNGIQPRIMSFLQKNAVTVEEFFALASAELGDKGPLLRQMKKLGSR